MPTRCMFETQRSYNLTIYGLMLGWSQEPGAGQRLHHYLETRHAD